MPYCYTKTALHVFEKKDTIFFNYLNNRKKGIILHSLKNRAGFTIQFLGESSFTN
jgi:hypothetical protein